MRRSLSVIAVALAACGAGEDPTPAAVASVPRGVVEAVEWCNGVDDNGDGFADETFECVAGTTESCVTPCSSWGLRTCSVACTFSDCAPDGEVCNGEDDDCDGNVDEDFGCVRDDVTLCAAQPRAPRGVMRCDSLCSPGPCEAIGREVCNGEDDDADGRADEDFECRFGTREVCDAAAATDRICSTICTWGACGREEVCNHEDDDADGKTDEGFGTVWVRPPFDVPDLSGPREEVIRVRLLDCSDTEAIIVQVTGNPATDRGAHVFLQRLTLDGADVHPPVSICPLEEWGSVTGGVRGMTHLWGDEVVTVCTRIQHLSSVRQDHLYVVDHHGAVVNAPQGDILEEPYSSCQLSVTHDRIVWSVSDLSVDNQNPLFLRTYDSNGTPMRLNLPMPFGCRDGTQLLVEDEHGPTFYIEAASDYVPGGGGIWRKYVDLDTGAILGGQELVPGRGGVENVVDGPGRTLLEYNGGVRAVFDDDGQMVGNKIFRGQGPNSLSQLRGRSIGTSFFVTGGLVGPARVTFDGRDGGHGTWDQALDPDIPGPGLFAEQTTCVTPSGQYLSLMRRSRPPIMRLYIADCAPAP